MQKKVVFVFGWLVRASVFMALSGLALAYYRKFDYWWFYATGTPYYRAEGLFVAGYGAVHIPSVVLTMAIMLAAILTPAVATLLMVGMDKLVTGMETAAEPGVTSEDALLD